jgi:hypothetical protein
MPKTTSILARLLPLWPVLLGIITLAGWGYKTIGDHAVKDRMRDQEIQTLKAIILGEWPMYTKSFYWEQK